MEARSWEWLPLVTAVPSTDLEAINDAVVDDDDVVANDDVLPAEREAAAAAKALVSWTGANGCVKRHLTAERAAAAGIQVERYFDADGDKVQGRYCGQVSNRISKVVRRVERAADPEEAQRMKDAEARRKRVRRIEEGKEDRDALRELASSRNDGTMLELEPTPAGLRETATDGTPRSAKAAGAKLRALTQTFYERLLDARVYGVTHNELSALRVETEYWDKSDTRRQHWETGTRPLKRAFGLGK